MDNNKGHWKRYPGPLPPMAVVGGHDTDGSKIYVGRAMYQGDHLAAKVIPSRNVAYVSWRGKEIAIKNYDIFCGHNHRWVHSSNGHVPRNAVRSGSTSSGEHLYIGRGHWQGSLTVGKIQRSQRCLYIPYGGVEYRLESYEVLILEQKDAWTSVNYGQIPPGSVVGGHDSDGGTIFIGRAHHVGEYLPDKVIPNKRCTYVSHSGSEIVKDSYQVLTGHGYGWAQSSFGFDHSWVHSHVDGALPELAVVGGHDSDGTLLFIGRAHHGEDLLPVKVNPSNRSAFTSSNGYEIFKGHYEVLCGMGYSWIHCENGFIPSNAVSCGRTCQGEIIYIGRGHFDRSLTVGKVFRGDDCLYIPYDGKERKVHKYEILIKHSYVIPVPNHDTTYTANYINKTDNYVILAKTGCYESEGSYVVPATTAEYYEKTGGYVVPAQAGGPCDNPPTYEKAPPTAGDPYPSIASAPSVSPPPTVVGFIKNEASSASPYPANAYPPPKSMVFIKNESYPPSTTGSVGPMHPPPPPYEAELKEEVAVVHKKPPAFGSQVLPPLPPPYQKEVEDVNNVIWIKWKSDNVPRDAIYAGVDTDLSTLYVGRCFHNGDLLPAKVNISKACAYVSFNGHEVLKEDYELLTGTGFEWIPSHDGYVPQDAVIGGRTAGGETLYIGRGHHMESITPGKIQPSENCLYIPFGGGEVKLQNYEVLVKRNGKLLNM